jgi:hypothetical protein
MGYVWNAVSISWDCVTLLAGREPGLFAVTFLAGIVLSAVCWWVCTNYSRLWNRSFRITRFHHVLCACAALLTLVFCVLFVSLRYAKLVAQQAIEEWSLEIRSSTFQDQVYRKTYDMVKATNLEDFRNSHTPRPGERGLIPLTQDESRRILASVPGDEAAQLFREENPFLGQALSVPTAFPKSFIEADEKSYFDQAHAAGQKRVTYPINNSIDRVASLLTSKLDVETPRVVVLARQILTAGFLVAQAVPFIVIGMAAYRDLKIST